MNKKHLVAALVILCLPLMYNACGQTPFGAIGFDIHQSSTGGIVEENKTKNPYALLSAEEVLKSFSSVTETPINNAIMNEYNARNTILSPNNDLKLSTAPMMIAIGNLAGLYCEEILNREVGLAAADRKFYPAINFGGNITAITDAQFQQSIENLAVRFWGRAPASAEVAALQTAKTEFNTALANNERNAAASSRNLMLFTCTGMLASVDSYTF